MGMGEHTHRRPGHGTRPDTVGASGVGRPPGTMARMTPSALDKAAAEGFALDLRTVLADAARALRGSKRVLVAGALAWLAISVAVGWITLVLGVGTELSSALGILATAPLTVGLVMAGARRAAGEPIAFADLWAYRSVTAHAAIVLLAGLLVVIGGDALMGPLASLPLTMAYGLFTALALYLVADRGLPAGRALVVSALLVRHRWGALLLLQLVLAALLALAIVPLGLGLVWAGPFAIVAQGAVYVRAVGLADGPRRAT